MKLPTWGQGHACLRKLTRRCLWCPAGSLSHLSFAEDTTADEDDQTCSQGTHRKKGNKLLEKTDMAGGKGELQSFRSARSRPVWPREHLSYPHRPLQSESHHSEGPRCIESVSPAVVLFGDSAPALLKWKHSGLPMQEEGGDVDVLGGRCPSGHLFYYQIWA